MVALQKHCRSGIRTNNFNLQNQNALIQVLRNNDTHCHLPEHGQVEELENINNMKDQIVAEPTVPIKRIYNRTVARAHEIFCDFEKILLIR